MAKLMVRIAAVGLLMIAAGCSSNLSQNEITSDSTHSFSILSTAIYDKIGEAIAVKDKVFLVVKYQIKDLQGRGDSAYQWTKQITLEGGEKNKGPVSIEAVDRSLWEASLPKNASGAEYLAFAVPRAMDDTYDYRLVFVFPTSKDKKTYQLSIVDKRIGSNVDWVLEKLRQMENSEKIPLIGGLASKARHIMYRGVVLVPKEQIPSFMEQTRNLPVEIKRAFVEKYLIDSGLCQFD